jgi:hypothetical protein
MRAFVFTLWAEEVAGSADSAASPADIAKKSRLVVFKGVLPKSGVPHLSGAPEAWHLILIFEFYNIIAEPGLTFLNLRRKAPKMRFPTMRVARPIQPSKRFA